MGLFVQPQRAFKTADANGNYKPKPVVGVSIQEKHMLRCIFCDNELTASTKPEHILLDALGGRKTTKRVDCSACNSSFGETIDKHLANQIEQVRNLMQFKSGSGDLAPQLRNVIAGDKRINIQGDGKLKFATPPFIITEIEDGRWNLQINVSSFEEIEHYIPHMAAKMR